MNGTYNIRTMAAYKVSELDGEYGEVFAKAQHWFEQETPWKRSF